MRQLQEGQGQLAEQLQQLLEEMQQGMGQEGQEGEGQMGENGEGGQGAQPFDGEGQEGGRALGRAGRAMGDASRSLGQGAPGDAYGYQGEALEALREGLQGMMQQMYANQPGMPGQQMGGRPNGQRDPLGRPQRTEGPDLGQNVKVPDEIDVERARQHPGGDPRAARRALPPALRAGLSGAPAQHRMSRPGPAIVPDEAVPLGPRGRSVFRAPVRCGTRPEHALLAANRRRNRSEEAMLSACVRNKAESLSRFRRASQLCRCDRVSHALFGS